MARCLRCKAGNEWIEGDVKPEPSAPSNALQNAAPQASANLSEDRREGGPDTGVTREDAKPGNAGACGAAPSKFCVICGWPHCKQHAHYAPSTTRQIDAAAFDLAKKMMRRSTRPAVHEARLLAQAVITLSEQACTLSATACREPTEDDLNIIESDLGMAKAGWGDVNGLEIVRACWRRYAAR